MTHTHQNRVLCNPWICSITSYLKVRSHNKGEFYQPTPPWSKTANQIFRVEELIFKSELLNFVCLKSHFQHTKFKSSLLKMNSSTTFFRFAVFEDADLLGDLTFNHLTFLRDSRHVFRVEGPV